MLRNKQLEINSVCFGCKSYSDLLLKMLEFFLAVTVEDDWIKSD